MKVAHHVIRSLALERGVLLAAIGPLSVQDDVTLFFKSGTPAEMIGKHPDFEVTNLRSIGNGLQVLGRAQAENGAGPLPLDAAPIRAPLRTPMTDLLAGKRVALALRGVESPQMIRDWLQFHARTHGLQAAVIVDRRPPEEATGLVRVLDTLDVAGIDDLLIVSFDTPVGQADAGDETLPFYAPDAPGKDRMAVPAPDPWRAPFAEIIVFELLRHLFLARAGGVMNIDLSDLLPESPDGTVFEQAAAAEDGVVTLMGTRVYPWGLRKGAAATYGDHICRRFDAAPANPRWCIAPARAPDSTVWRHVRIVGARPGQNRPLPYLRCMGLRHTGGALSEIAPKSSLVEDPALLALATSAFDADPRRAPRQKLKPHPKRIEGRSGIITCMKNEGPFILEWIAYHRAIGVDDFLVYTNDCTDGTDDLLDLLQARGILQHRDNPYRTMGMKPQHAALHAADKEALVQTLDWIICTDVDEFINIHVGDGRLADLFAAIGDANLVSMTWRLFGNADVAGFRDGFVTDQFHLCAPQLTRKPHQAWGFKTAFRALGIFKKLGVHRPKGLRPQLVDQVRWVNGSGHPLPRKDFRNAWRSTAATYGYDLVTLNHYALRSAESFLVKRDRGRVNHVDRDQGLNYWFRMNHNVEEDRSIARMIPAARAEVDRLMADPEIAAAHAACVAAHRAKIDALMTTDKYRAFFAEITSERMRKLSRMLPHFGANVFLSGPDVIPDTVLQQAGDPDFFFTVKDVVKGG